jgi:hypothetical protein
MVRNHTIKVIDSPVKIRQPLKKYYAENSYKTPKTRFEVNP